MTPPPLSPAPPGADERIILGIDPGTQVLGYGVLAVAGRKPRMVAMGVVRLNRFETHYLRLRRIFERVTGLVEQYLPDEMAIEAPFYGKNVQSMLKLGRAQGVAMAAALTHDVPITEYEPSAIKQAVAGSGAASKEQLREMLRRILAIPDESMLPELDATDALGAALCHFYETMAGPFKGAPTSRSRTASGRGAGSWKDFVERNPGRVKK